MKANVIENVLLGGVGVYFRIRSRLGASRVMIAVLGLGIFLLLLVVWSPWICAFMNVFGFFFLFFFLGN